MIIAVVDAQGAGIGKSVIKEIRRTLGHKVKIYALGTNETACRNMEAAGADAAVCGASKIIEFLKKRTVDCLVGPMGIISSGGIKGEITPLLSRCIFETECKKYIIPLDMHGIFIPGTRSMKIRDSIREIIQDIRESF